MKSTIIFTSILSLALAGPISTRQETDPCACDYICLPAEPFWCECIVNNEQRCYKEHTELGVQCPPPQIPDRCNTFTILPISEPAPAATAAPQVKPKAVANKLVKESEEPSDECACDFFCITQVGPDCDCEIKNKNECYARQLAAGLNCPAPVITDRCAKGKPPRSEVPAPGEIGDRCDGGRGAALPPCGENLTCVHDKPGCADCFGTCAPKVCGGLLGIDCPKPLTCVLDPECVSSNTSDCQGVCEAQRGVFA